MDDYLSKPLRLDALGPMLAKWIPHAAAVHGGSVLVDQAAEARTGVPATKLTVAGAAKLVDRWAAALVEDDKISSGDRVVLAMPNSVELFLATLAVSRAGAIPAPVNDAMRDDEIAHVVLDANARAKTASQARKAARG